MERYHKLLKEQALLGIIISNTWLHSLKLQKIRKYLVNNYVWQRILHLPEKVFDAVVDTHVLIFKKINQDIATEHACKIDIRQTDAIFCSHLLEQIDIPKDGSTINILARKEHRLLNEKLKKYPIFDANVKITQGTKPFQVGKGKPPQTREILNEKPFVSERKIDKSFRPLLRGSLIQKYKIIWNENYYISFGDGLPNQDILQVMMQQKKLLLDKPETLSLPLWIHVNL